MKPSFLLLLAALSGALPGAMGAAEAPPGAPQWTRQRRGNQALLRGVSAVNERGAWAVGNGGTVAGLQLERRGRP